MPFDSAPELKPEQRILLDAALIVRERWLQGSLGLPGGPRCAMGAVQEANNRLGFIDSTGEVGAALHAFGRQIGTNMLGDWNDAPGRTCEEVATALEQAAVVGVER